MISNLSATEWIYVSTVLITLKMLRHRQNMWNSQITHTLQEEATFTVRYVVVS
jgi:hypothetical protein